MPPSRIYDRVPQAELAQVALSVSQDAPVAGSTPAHATATLHVWQNGGGE